MTEHLPTEERNLIWSLHLVRGLYQSGVRHFVVSSGSRCSPLVLAVAHTLGIHIWTQIDERSAAFWGLGIGKATRHPAAVIGTSGTAAANDFPAVIEARLSRTPLIILTADRPPELRRKGAPQTIDQVDLYGRYPLFFCDLPAPDDPGSSKAEWERIGTDAVRASLGPSLGPVHLNVPFREPLIPDPERTNAIISALQFEDGALSPEPVGNADPASPRQVLSGEIWDQIADRMSDARQGLIVCGPQNAGDDLGPAVAALAAASGFPALADIASQARFGVRNHSNVISHHDLCLRDPAFASGAPPDLVIRLGGLPTSKILNEWLAAQTCEQILVDDHADIADPYATGTLTIVSNLDKACASLARRLRTIRPAPNDYLSRWRTADTKTAELLHEGHTENGQPFEGDIVASVFRLAPAGTTIVLSNSLPIRLAEFYATGHDRPVRVLCNRGANGIDGVVSTAGGIAAALQHPVVLVIGDVALLHDLNGLLEVRRTDLPLKIVLLNNDGGGIFSFLPIAAHRDLFEPLVAMPQGRDFAHAAAFHGVLHRQIESLAEFNDAYAHCLASPGPELLEIRSDRSHTLAVSQTIERLVSAKIGGSA